MVSPSESRQSPATESTIEIARGATRDNLLRGISKHRLIGSLSAQGWPRDLAKSFVDEVERSAHSQLRRRALSIAVGGAGWLAGGTIAVIGSHSVTGHWSTSGPWPLAWLFVLYGSVRLMAGLISATIHAEEVCAPGLDGDATLEASRIADHQLLGLRPGASLSELHAAYRDLVKIWHPDQFAVMPDMRHRAEMRLKAINNAYLRLRREANSGNRADNAEPRA